MLIYLSAMQFPGALSYLATLDEDVRSDTALKDLYDQCFALYTMDSLFQKKDFDTGIQFYERLEGSIKSSPEAVSIYRKLRTGIIVDSVMNEGSDLFRRKLHKRALESFRLVSEKYDPGNILADSMIKVIESLALNDTEIHPNTISAECFYYGKSLRIGQQPDVNSVKLISVCFTSAQQGNEMVITLEIQRSDFVVIIAGPNSEKAYFVEYGKGVEVLNLLDVRGIKTNIEQKVLRPTKIDLVFAKLPAGIKQFNLREGKNFQEPGRWDFIDIQLISN
jgi:hypothetical protein